MQKNEPRPTKPGGFPFCWQYETDLQHILDTVEGTDACFCISVYVGLSRLANQHRSNTFEATVNKIAKYIGLHYRKLFYTLRLLERIGLVRIKARRLPGTKGHAPSLYTLCSIDRTLTHNGHNPCVQYTDTLQEKKEVRIPPPPAAHGFSVFVPRFRNIGREEFQSKRFDDQSIFAVLQAYEPAVIESALADMEAKAPGEVRTINPLAMLRAFLRTAKAQAATP
ncbi:MAG: hypothetical protein V2A34_11100, partial [Lentisphaerota bacterium]